jgi:hypothetical protein
MKFRDGLLGTSNDLLNVRWTVALGYCFWLMGYEVGPDMTRIKEAPRKTRRTGGD